MGDGVPLADPVFRSGGVLESGGSGIVRVSDQSASSSLLYAGLEHHARSRSRRFVRCLWDARHRLDALLLARPDQTRALEIPYIVIQFLVFERRAGAHGSHQPTAGRTAANLG